MPAVFYFLGLLLLFFSPASCDKQSSTTSEYKTYIVHVERTPDHIGSHKEWHESFLPSGDYVGSKSQLVFSYGHVFSGFAAHLTETELEAMRTMEGFVHAQPDRVLTLDTTHTPTFLGLNRVATGFWTQSDFGNGTIIGVLDTGIEPTHPSFSDDGMPPPPPKWKGRCDFTPSSLCNNKIIGARSFLLGNTTEMSPFDFNGHGTHVSGTAGGRFVANASVLGSASGTAVGMAPYAHLAIYKVCNADGKCSDSAVLAAVDAAVKDGVDVISMSLGDSAVPLYNDQIAIASFHATKLGVFFSSSAGNSGPANITLENVAPWMLTVGASTMNRRIRSVVKLGNGIELEGESAYQPENFPSTLLPLVFPTSLNDPLAYNSCSNLTTLLEKDVVGKVVLCFDVDIDNTERNEIVKAAGAAAMILMNSQERGFDTIAVANLIPASHVSFEDGVNILTYLSTTLTPMATIIFKGTQIGGLMDPSVAAFSSRGPSVVTPGVLKPDIIGPGVNVLAAWHESVGPFEVLPHFNMISGTSMSCPHLSGIAALLKSAHPDWSPAMIKSALMTTTDVTNLNGTRILDNLDRENASFFSMGSGHVNPTRANNPGLVYDIQPEDYIGYLCAIGYNDTQVSIVAQATTSCSTIEFTDLNYPSFLFDTTTSNSSTQQAYRTLTNVGAPNSTYTVVVSPPSAVTVTVQPDTISFSTIGEKKSFTVNFVLQNGRVVPPGFTAITEGFLTWVSSDNLIQVKSPISVIIGAPFEPQPTKTSKVTLHRAEHH